MALARALGYFGMSASASQTVEPPALISLTDVPTRAAQIKRLREETFDVIIVGGGATGTGAALDAAARGLRVALVERSDFSAGTSSKSTKIVHGGVRYLEKAFWEASYEQFALVRKALSERATWFTIAPHIVDWLPIMLPVTTWWRVPYYWAGAKAYDLVAGWPEKRSYFLSARKSIEAFPMLSTRGLLGSIVYYDGQADDSRMNVTLALSAACRGAAVANYCDVREVLHDKTTRRTCGVRVFDRESREFFDIRGRVVVAACGPFTDALRQMELDSATLVTRGWDAELRSRTSRAVQTDDVQSVRPMVRPSSGTHAIMPAFYSPHNMGLIDPSTSDGRVIFFLPWLGHTIVGTTDSPCLVDRDPSPTENEIRWILKEVAHYLCADLKVRREDVLSAWTGIRPLVSNPAAQNTEALSRDHVVNVTEHGMVVVAGGKWTTYREMAADAVSKAVEVGELTHAGPCITATLQLLGAPRWNRNYHIRLIQEYGVEPEIAAHLSRHYGDQADVVAELMRDDKRNARLLVDHYPYVEAEVRVACRSEYARSASDVLGRRLRLAFLNRAAAAAVAPRVIAIMAEELGWSPERIQKERLRMDVFLATFGGPEPLPERAFRKATSEEIRQAFTELDKDGKGSIDAGDLRRAALAVGKAVSRDAIERALKDMDPDADGKVSWVEFEHWWYKEAKSEEAATFVKIGSTISRNEYP